MQTEQVLDFLCFQHPSMINLSSASSYATLCLVPPLPRVAYSPTSRSLLRRMTDFSSRPTVRGGLCVLCCFQHFPVARKQCGVQSSCARLFRSISASGPNAVKLVASGGVTSPLPWLLSWSESDDTKSINSDTDTLEGVAAFSSLKPDSIILFPAAPFSRTGFWSLFTALDGRTGLASSAAMSQDPLSTAASSHPRFPQVRHDADA